MKTPEQLRERASNLRLKADRFSARSRNAGMYAPGSFVTGNSGRTASQNRATERGLEATIRYAVKAVALRRKADELERRADFMEWQGSSAYEALLKERAAARERTQAEERERRRTLRAGPLRERIFVGVYSEGLVYSDRAVEVNGDYRALAFLSYRTLDLSFYDSCPRYLMPAVVSMAQSMMWRAGDRFQVSTCGQFVILGAT